MVWWKSPNNNRVALETLERLRFTFTPNGKREFVPGDQDFP